MTTDWKLIRNLMAAVIDTCEDIEAAGYAEADRGRTVVLREQPVTLYDVMVSAQTLPEQLRYEVIRERRDKGADAAYVPEAARMIVRMAEACSELVGADETKPAEEFARWAIDWYRQVAGPAVCRALGKQAGEQGASNVQ